MEEMVLIQEVVLKNGDICQTFKTKEGYEVTYITTKDGREFTEAEYFLGRFIDL